MYTRLLRAQERAREEAFDDKARAELAFFGYVAAAYRHFLAGDDAACAAVDEQQAAAFRARADAARARNAELQQVGEPVLALAPSHAAERGFCIARGCTAPRQGCLVAIKSGPCRPLGVEVFHCMEALCCRLGLGCKHHSPACRQG
jgi:hypothetical protein